MLRAHDGDFRNIVNIVLKMRQDTKAYRKEIINTPSIIRAEFTREIEELQRLRDKINVNVQRENEVQKKKVAKLKQKYDREGVNFVEETGQMGRDPQTTTNLGPQPDGPPVLLPPAHPSMRQQTEP